MLLIVFNINPGFPELNVVVLDKSVCYMTKFKWDVWHKNTIFPLSILV